MSNETKDMITINAIEWYRGIWQQAVEGFQQDFQEETVVPEEGGIEDDGLPF
jgi:hypothetical protein